MIHKVYSRDWYFNAGINGFLSILADDRTFEELVEYFNDYSSINREDNLLENSLFEQKEEKGKILEIGENYIEFDDSIFDIPLDNKGNTFKEKYTEILFLKMFNNDKETIESKIRYIIKNLEKETIGKLKKTIENKTITNFFNIMKYKYDISDKVRFLEDLNKILEKLSSTTTKNIYEYLLKIDDGTQYIESYINMKIKRIFNNHLEKAIKNIRKNNDSKNKKLSNNDICIACQDKNRKATNEFSNAISNIIGFNPDNSNWIWGFKSSNLKICDICSLIYMCSFFSFVYINKSVGSNYLVYMYFLNYNSNIESLFREIFKFKNTFIKSEDKKNIFFSMVKETVYSIITKKEQSKNIKENINFIEMADNPMLGGQSTKGYNIYNYNIDYNTAEFLNSYLESIPKGYYTINEIRVNLEEKILYLIITNKISYSDINRYINIKINETIEKKIDLDKTIKFIFNYINFFQEVSMNKENNDDITGLREKIGKKAFMNGKSIREKMLLKDKKNQIDGLVYQFLNDLKIIDRDRFLDKYIRLSLANAESLRFANDEMNDQDNFLQFGYSFLNGLLYEEWKNKNDKENKAEEVGGTK